MTESEVLQHVLEERSLVVVCGPHHHGISGSRQERCGCGAVMWMTPNMQAMLAARTTPAALLCLDCAVRVFGQGKGVDA